MSETNYESMLNEAASELIPSEAPAESAPAASTEGQAETPPAITKEKPEDVKNILEQVAKEEPPTSTEWLAQLNALGMVRNGSPIEVKDAAQVKELIQKGFDYTEKTMALSKEAQVKAEEWAAKETQYKAREEQLTLKEQELSNVSFENKIMENMLLKWQQSDPELFNYLSQAYKQEVSAFEMQKPIIAQYEGKFKQLEERFASLEQGKQQEQLGNIKQTWETELGTVQTQYAGSLSKLGVKPDWDKVKEAWAADSTGKMTVEQALYATYGKAIADANKSYQNKLATQNKAMTSKLGRTGVGSAQTGAKETIKVDSGNYESLVRQLAAQF